MLFHIVISKIEVPNPLVTSVTSCDPNVIFLGAYAIFGPPSKLHSTNTLEFGDTTLFAHLSTYSTRFGRGAADRTISRMLSFFPIGNLLKSGMTAYVFYSVELSGSLAKEWFTTWEG